ncbi:large ribosomal subunit protein uL13-like [Musa acuminata AAA Group]|uniref:large ribosomal subunit protein uL13-like n=1 Tax=Musa acuminata AAA Group TaxID=214697 RepID=UPI0031D2846F
MAAPNSRDGPTCHFLSKGNATRRRPYKSEPVRVPRAGGVIGDRGRGRRGERSLVAVAMVSGSVVCAQWVVVDPRHHMLGRLASFLAKELLNGQRVAVVRCEDMCLSGGLDRQKIKYLRFLRKLTNTKCNIPY